MEKYIIFLMLTILMGACSSPKYLSKPIDFKYHVKGLFLEYEINKDSTLLGEIIEVNAEAIMILPIDQKGAELISIPKEKILHAEIIVSSTSDNPKMIQTWAGLINLASIGHGFLLIFTLPINLGITLTIANDAAKGTYRIKYPDNINWNDMTKFARFPQGIPQNVDQKDLE